MTEILFIRSAPLNVTPAVGRYARFLRSTGGAKTLHGLELDYGQPRPAVDFVDELHTLRRPFQGTLQRVMAMLAWQLYQLRILFRLRPRLIQFCDVFSVPAVLVAKLLLGARLVFDIRDAARLAVSHRGWLVGHLLGALEGIGALASDAVIVVARPLAAALPPSVRDGCFVIPNAPPVDLYKAPRFSDDGRLRVNLSGFVSYRRNLEAWCAVSTRRKRLALDLYGNVADEATQRILEMYGIPAVLRLDHAEALKRTEDCDAVTLMYDPSIEINRFAAPNKLYEALMLGKPIVCAVGMRMADELLEWDCGLAVPYGDVDALEAAVERLSNIDERARLGGNARNLFLERYSGCAEREMTRLYTQLGLTLQARSGGGRGRISDVPVDHESPL